MILWCLMESRDERVWIKYLNCASYPSVSVVLTQEDMGWGMELCLTEALWLDTALMNPNHGKTCNPLMGREVVRGTYMGWGCLMVSGRGHQKWTRDSWGRVEATEAMSHQARRRGWRPWWVQISLLASWHVRCTWSIRGKRFDGWLWSHQKNYLIFQ